MKIHRQNPDKALGVLIVLTAVFLLSMAVFGQTTAIRAGNLVDPASGTVAKGQIILIEKGKIAEVGPNVRIPAGAQVIDLSSAWVTPGLMDAHTHITLDFDMASGFDIIYLRESSAMRALRGLRTAEDILQVGFTAVKDVGNDANYAAVDIRDALRKGWFTGPTVLTTGKIIAPFGGQTHRIAPEQGFFWLFDRSEPRRRHARRR